MANEGAGNQVDSVSSTVSRPALALRSKGQRKFRKVGGTL